MEKEILKSRFQPLPNKNQNIFILSDSKFSNFRDILIKYSELIEIPSNYFIFVCFCENGETKGVSHPLIGVGNCKLIPDDIYDEAVNRIESSHLNNSYVIGIPKVALKQNIALLYNFFHEFRHCEQYRYHAEVFDKCNKIIEKYLDHNGNIIDMKGYLVSPWEKDANIYAKEVLLKMCFTKKRYYRIFSN